MNRIIFEQVVSLVGLTGLWAMWFKLLRPQRVDAFRQKLFAIRGELFDLAANGSIPFSDPAYLQLRLMINGMIRFAHHASLLSLTVSILRDDRASSRSLSKWTSNVKKLPNDSQKRILEVHYEASTAFAKHLIGGSILLKTYLLLRVVYASVKAVFLLVAGRRELSAFTFSHAVDRVVVERNKAVKAGARAIEARVLFDEERRSAMKDRHAYAI